MAGIRSGGAQPRWSPDGRELYFVSVKNELSAAAVDGRGSRFVMKACDRSFASTCSSVRGPGLRVRRSSDGKRLLVSDAGEAASPASRSSPTGPPRSRSADYRLTSKAPLRRSVFYNLATILTLTAGSRLGPYEILSPLGAGGMGEVYRARDTRLERTVAVKVLPDHLSSPEARQRFEREAKTISQLSHPHICALYDVGHEDGRRVPRHGVPRGRDARGPARPRLSPARAGAPVSGSRSPTRSTGRIARASSTATSSRRNVMLTKSGVKLLDFGLAKLSEPPAGVVPGSRCS